MGFYHFSQNNSGGSFESDKSSGITHHVIVEGRDWKDVKHRAEDIGLYWNGCDSGRDCSCCGDRWSDYGDNDDLTDEPMIYGDPVTVPLKYPWFKSLGDVPGETAVHYLDGRIEWFHGA